MNKFQDQFISIGLPIYNQEKNIVKCVQSILSQTHVNFELLISDDCSTDNTIRICEDFSKKDKRVKLFKQKKNLGVSDNFYLNAIKKQEILLLEFLLSLHPLLQDRNRLP